MLTVKAPTGISETWGVSLPGFVVRPPYLERGPGGWLAGRLDFPSSSKDVTWLVIDGRIFW
jgi:hypothetical protein